MPTTYRLYRPILALSLCLMIAAFFIGGCKTSKDESLLSDDSATKSAEAYRKAQLVWLDDDYEGALQLFSDYLTVYPDTELTAAAQFWQGRCFMKLERYEEAIGVFETLRASHPDHPTKVPQAMQGQAVALARLGRNEEAKTLLHEVVERYPTSGAASQATRDLEKLSKN